MDIRYDPLKNKNTENIYGEVQQGRQVFGVEGIAEGYHGRMHVGIYFEDRMVHSEIDRVERLDAAESPQEQVQALFDHACDDFDSWTFDLERSDHELVYVGPQLPEER